MLPISRRRPRHPVATPSLSPPFSPSPSSLTGHLPVHRRFDGHTPRVLDRQDVHVSRWKPMVAEDSASCARRNVNAVLAGPGATRQRLIRAAALSVEGPLNGTTSSKKSREPGDWNNHSRRVKCYHDTTQRRIFGRD